MKDFARVKAACEYIAGHGVYCWSDKRKAGTSLCAAKNCPKMRRKKKMSDRKIITFEQVLGALHHTREYAYTTEEIKADFDNLPDAEPIIEAAKFHWRALILAGCEDAADKIEAALEAAGEKI